MRISLTVLPVGPRGQGSLDRTPVLTFALQVTAGYQPDDPESNFDALWPWSYLKPGEDGRIPVSAWLAMNSGGPPVTRLIDIVEVVECVETFECDPENRFTKSLRKSVQDSYKDVGSKLNLHLYFPQELAEIAQRDGEAKLAEILEQNFPSRVNYLSSLPGEISRRLISTVYLRISRDDLFEKNAQDVWQAKDGFEVIWITPKTVTREGTGYDWDGNLEPSPDFTELWTIEYPQGQTRSYGPGYELKSITNPSSGLFDLSSYWLPVSQGDARYNELESFLVKVIDPLAETRRIYPPALRGALKTKYRAAPERALVEEELQTAHMLWQIQALAKEIDWKTGIVQRALSRLFISFDRQIDVEASVNKVSDALQASLGGDLLETTEVIARLLGVNSQMLANGEEDKRSLVKQVSKLASLDGLCQYLERALESTLHDPSLSKVAEDWNFAEMDKPSQVTERRRARAHIAIEEAIESTHVATLLKRLSISPTDAIKDLREAGIQKELLAERWTARLSQPVAQALVNLGFLGENASLKLEAKVQKALAKAYIDESWPTTTKGTEAAGRPIDLVMGDTRHRLIHELDKILPGKTPGGEDGVFNEVTGHTMLVRRGETKTTVENASWRIVSGGVVTAGRPNAIFEPDDDCRSWLPELLPIAEENVFLNGLLRSDRGYDGQLRHIQSPLDFAYAHADGISDSNENTFSYDTPYSYQGLGSYSGSSADIDKMASVMKAPPLRFGDWYQFAASLVDAASGVAPEIARSNEPWRADPSKIDSNSKFPNRSKAIPYLRRQPVGEVNLIPDRDAEINVWPQTPPKIVLRAREWQRALKTSSDKIAGPGNDNAPEVLLWQGDGFRESHPNYPNSRPNYVVELEPPSIDEFTLRRWVTPKQNLSDTRKDQIKTKLTSALANLYETRRSSKFDPKSMVHDPAVTAIGVRVQVFNLTGERVVYVDDEKKLEEALPYRSKPIKVRLSVDPAATKSTIEATLESDSDTRVTLALPDGWFASIDTWPLVKKAEIRRFDSHAKPDATSETTDHPGSTSYVAFERSRLLVEAASASLPTPHELYQGLRLAPDGDNVRVTWSGTDTGSLQMIDRFTINRERWIWRNRPVLASFDDQTSEAERRRLFASGLPAAAFYSDKRDKTGPVTNWEENAKLDRGFIDRGTFSEAWKRTSPQPDLDGGAIVNDTTLLLDTCDGVTGGDYLRFGLKVQSRYAPILKKPDQEAKSQATDNTWRRIVMPYRGSGIKLKPPKILSILPLTRSLTKDPLTADDMQGSQVTGPTPFLVIVDETWFREYGVGERLEARLALEHLDLGENKMPGYKGRPYRTGPLPDHWLQDEGFRKYYRQKLSKTDEDESDPIRLDVFGPFGYTLDVVADESLANASAFVVYVPDDVGPHFAAFATFRRALEQPEQTIIYSKPGGDYPLYTLPDERGLVSIEKRGFIEFSRRDSLFDLRLNNIELSLDPLHGSPTDTPGLAKSRIKATQNYRYFMLLSETISVAGQAEIIERPIAILRLTETANLGGMPTYQAEPLSKSPALSKPEYTARILEIRLNGIYQPGASRLDPKKNNTEITQREFWDRILTPRIEGKVSSDKSTAARTKGYEEDAAGMIRRISDSVIVKIA